MRPALGTFVEMEISYEGRDSDGIFDEAFEAISRIENLLSFFKVESEVGRFNVLEVGQSLQISPDFSEILQNAAELYFLSGGAFDISQGSGLIFELSLGQVKKIKEGQINLGGIAKGLAVDRAVETLRKFTPSGIVNAGGDLRIFGDVEHKIFFRVPGLKGNHLYDTLLSRGAVATSSIGHETVSVFADTCMIADALTKVVLHGNPAALDRCLHRHSALAHRFENETASNF
jgi:thiamine biosynthesis lipoprotein